LKGSRARGGAGSTRRPRIVSAPVRPGRLAPEKPAGPRGTSRPATRAAAAHSLRGALAGAPLETAWTLPSTWYLDAAHHASEMERVFRRSWQAVGRTTQVARAGDYFAADVAGESILVVRGRDGGLRAFHNVCRHRAGAVVRGEGCAPALRCTYHGWTYDLDGSLRAAPEMDGTRDFDRGDFGLVTLRCEAWEQYVFVHLDPAAAPLASTLGPLPDRARDWPLERLTFRLRQTYEISCNWKVYVDNYLEGYHIPRAHPGLHAVLDYKRYAVHPEGATVVQVAPYRNGARTTRAPAGSSQAEAGSSGADTRTPLYLWLYPNFMLNLSAEYVQSNVIVPLGPERTLTVFDYYFDDSRGPVSEEDVRRSVAWSDEIQQQDIALCEAVQRNQHSRSYLAGRYCARRENGLHHFHELLRRVMR